jgi:hypothetical protein
MDEASFQSLVLRTLEKFMGDLTSLNAAVAANTQAVSDVTAAVTTLKSEVAAGAAADQAAIDAATAQITANTTALEALKSS